VVGSRALDRKELKKFLFRQWCLPQFALLACAYHLPRSITSEPAPSTSFNADLERRPCAPDLLQFERRARGRANGIHLLPTAGMLVLLLSSVSLCLCKCCMSYVYVYVYMCMCHICVCVCENAVCVTYVYVYMCMCHICVCVCVNAVCVTYVYVSRMCMCMCICVCVTYVYVYV
jgi:hypothetical protein